MIPTLIGLIVLIVFIYIGIVATHAGQEYDNRIDDIPRHKYPKK